MRCVIPSTHNLQGETGLTAYPLRMSLSST